MFSRKQARSRQDLPPITRTQRLILITLAIGVFMGALDMSILSPAYLTLQKTFSVAANTITWVVTIYALVYVVCQPLIAKLSDLYGRKWLYIACVGLFGGGSLLCGLSNSFPLFLLGRAIQACGAGGVLPVASAVVGDIFPKERRGMALGIIGSLFGVAGILGPNLGGWLAAGNNFLGLFTTSWHEIFFLNVPLAVVIIILASRFTMPRRTAKVSFDWLGALVLSLMLFSLVYGLTFLDFRAFLHSITTWPVGPSLLCALILLLLFPFIERRAIDPLINIAIFARRQIALAAFLSIAAGIAIVTVFFIPVLAQYVLGYKPDQAGSMVTISAVMLLFMTPLVGAFIDRVGAKVIVFLGSFFSTGALYLLSIVAPGQLWLFIVALTIVGIGLASFLGTPLRYIILNEAPVQQRASSLAILGIGNSLGQTIGVPLAGSMIASQAAPIIGLHQFYLFASVVLACMVVLSLFLKSRKQEQRHEPDQEPEEVLTQQVEQNV